MAEVESTKKDDPPTQKIETPTRQTNDEDRMSNVSGGSTRPSLYLEASFASTSKSKSANKTSAATSLTKKRTTERLRSMTTDAGGENLVSSSSVTSTRKSVSNTSMAIPFGDKTNDLPAANKSASDENCSLNKENGFQRGLKPEKIVELEEKDGERKFLIKWIGGSHSSEYGKTLD